MRRKILLTIMMILIIILGCSLVYKTYKDKYKVSHNELMAVFNDLNELSTKLNKYQIKNNGKIEVSANYKGAHGENLPRTFNYNYALMDNQLYLANEDGYNILTINQELLSFLRTITKIGNIDDTELTDITNDFCKTTVNINPQNFNKLYGTNFNNIEATIYFSNILSKKIEKTIIKLDNIIVTKKDSNYGININNDNIKFNFNKMGYSLNINDYIKMNVFNDNYEDRYSLVVGNYVYSFTLKNEGIDFVASTGVSIYNSINVVVNYEDTELILDKELDIQDNPITRYFSEIK